MALAPQASRRRPARSSGRARVGKRTKDLIKRLEPGRHRGHRPRRHRPGGGRRAHRRRRRRPSSTPSPSITGRYPNGGPLRLVAGRGRCWSTTSGPSIMDAVIDGRQVRAPATAPAARRRRRARRAGTCSARTRSTRRMEEARAGIGHELQRFAENTLEYVRREAELVFAPLVLPELRTSFAGRHALVVVRGHDYKQDLRVLRAYIREYQPVLIGVDGGADALLEVGLTPDIILGDFDSVSEQAHGRRRRARPPRAPRRAEPRAARSSRRSASPTWSSSSRAPARTPPCSWPTRRGAKLIVAVGTHDTMVEFLDKGRAGMSSTFLTRLRLGPMLVDAKGVARLYEATVRRGDLVLLVVAALAGHARHHARLRTAARVPRRGLADAARPLVRRHGHVLTRPRPRRIMISFRFHVVSITAVFLAIAIGVVVGSDLRRRRRGRRAPQPDRHRVATTSTSARRRTTGSSASSDGARATSRQRRLRGHRPPHRRAGARRGRARRRRGRGRADTVTLARQAGARRARRSSGSSPRGRLDGDGDRDGPGGDRRGAGVADEAAEVL